MKKSWASRHNTLGADSDRFIDRQVAALRQRLIGELSRKMLAREIGVHPHTVANWANGHSTMDGEAIAVVNEFFRSNGSQGFIDDLYGPARSRSHLIVGLNSTDICLWFADDGAMHEAPAGHGKFVRDAIRISALAADLSEYAIRNLGWIECLLRTDGRARIRLCPSAATPAAAARARDWFLNSGGQHATVVEMWAWNEGKWKQIACPSVSDAIRSLDRAGVVASFNRISERNWVVERLSLDDLPESPVAAVIAAARQGADPIETLGRLGLMGTSSIFSTANGEIVSCHIGAQLDIPIDDFVNRNVLDRYDREYGAFVHHFVSEAMTEDITYYRNKGVQIDGRFRNWESVAIKNGPTGVVTTTRLL